MLEAEIVKLQETVSLQSERISTEKSVGMALRRIISKKVERMSSPASDQTLKDVPQYSLESPTISVTVAPSFKTSLKLFRKESINLVFCDTNTISNNGGAEAESPIISPEYQSQEAKVRNQLITIQTLSRKLETVEVRR